MPKVNIGFFETSSKDAGFFRRRSELSCHNLYFNPEPINAINSSKIRNLDIISTFIYSKITPNVLKNCPRLKFIATRSTGYDHIDMTACHKRGIIVSNVPTYGENTVAEHAFALILALSRNIHKAHVRTTRGDFSLSGLTGFDLKGKILGVLGTGKIGMHVIHIAKSFGMTVIAYDLYKNTVLAGIMGFEYVNFDRLLAESDILTLHLPYAKETHHIINAEAIKKMKKGALLINTARGALVDTNALALGLNEGKIGGAGLDVLEGENLIKEEHQILSHDFPVEHLKTLIQNHILLNRDNVVITPHIAFNSAEALLRILNTTEVNITSFLAGKPENVVS